MGMQACVIPAAGDLGAVVLLGELVEGGLDDVYIKTITFSIPYILRIFLSKLSKNKYFIVVK